MSDTASTAPATDHYLSTSRESIIGGLWRFRELLLRLVARDLKVKYQRSALGLLWTLLNPLLMVLVFVMIFNSVLRVKVDGFWAFLISGIFAWRSASDCLNRATTVLRTHAGLRRSVAFPSEVVIFSTVLTKLVEFLFAMAIVLFAMFVFYHNGVPVTVVLLPYLILLQVLMTAGIMFPLSVLAVMYYDVEHAMPAIMRLWFFLTPVFYPVSMIPESIRPYFYLNPFVGLVQLYHKVLYEGVWPSWELLGLVTLTAVGLFVVGYWLFNRSKDSCVEIA